MKIEIDIKKIDGQYEIRCEELDLFCYRKYLSEALKSFSEQIYLMYIILPKDKNDILNETGIKHKKKIAEID